MKCLKLKLLFLLFVSALSAYPQEFEYPMRILYGYPYRKVENYTIDLVGGNPQFVIRSLQSDWGEGTEEEDRIGLREGVFYSRHTWKNLSNKKWSSEPFSLSLSYTTGAHPDYYMVQMHPIPNMILEFQGKNSRDLLADSVTSKAIRSYILEKLFYGYAQVNSADGVNVRKGPSLDSPVVHKLRDQDKAILAGNAGAWKKTGEQDAGWIKVYVGRQVWGYVKKDFLIPWHAIHPRKLEDALSMSFTYTAKGQTLFELYPGRFYINEEGHYIRKENYSETWKDTLHQLLGVELVQPEAYISRKVRNPYGLDTSYADAPTPRVSGYLSEYRDSFFLKTGSKRDTLFIREEPDEFPPTRYYTGKIPGFNQYVFSEYSFGRYYMLYDMTTGEKHGHEGLPYVSPDGRYIVELKHESDPEIYDDPHTGVIVINKVDKGFKTFQTFRVAFASWLPDETPNSAWWVSDRELIIRVISVPALFSTDNWLEEVRDIPAGEAPYQYIRLTIK